MFEWLKKLLKRIPREGKVAIVGLDGAGKTTLLNQLKVKKPLKTVPTIGINYQEIVHDGIHLHVWDLGGQKNIRPFWEEYVRNANALIYLVDLSDRTRIYESKEEFWNLVRKGLITPHVPIFLVLNKIDRKDKLSIEEVISIFELEKLIGFNINLIQISALTGENITNVMNSLMVRYKS